MHCISVKQPWAWALCVGIKDIENREWMLSTKYATRRVGIHASKGLTTDEYLEAAEFCRRAGLVVPAMTDLVRGAIIGALIFTGNVTSSGSAWFQGTYGWVATGAQLFAEPIPYKGKGALSFWEPDTLTQMAMMRQLIQQIAV